MNVRQVILGELAREPLTKIALYNRLKERRWVPLRDLEEVLDELHIAEQLIAYEPRTKTYSLTQAGREQVKGKKS